MQRPCHPMGSNGVIGPTDKPSRPSLGRPGGDKLFVIVAQPSAPSIQVTVRATSQRRDSTATLAVQESRGGGPGGPQPGTPRATITPSRLPMYTLPPITAGDE